MKNVLFFLSIVLPIILICTYKTIQSLYYFEQVIFPPKGTDKTALNPKDILIVNTSGGAFGGAEMYCIVLYKNLVKNGHNVHFLAVKNSGLEQKLQQEKISHHAYNKFEIFKSAIQPGFYYAMYKICKKHNIDIIHCNLHRETIIAKKVRSELGTKVILTCHIPQKLKSKYLENLDGFLGVNPQIAASGNNKNLCIKEAVFIPPFFEEEYFLNFKPSEKKKVFFKNNFNIDIQETPILCMVANMPTNVNHKNHPFLLKAVAKIIHEKQIPIQVILAGDGPMKEQLIQMSKNLKIEKYIHFLGFTNKVAEILYHSDIKILTSKEEGLPIVLFEAALLKKPLIGGRKTSLENVAIHEKTGLLFEQDNVESLVAQIETLLDNPSKIKELGENAYNLVIEKFSTKINMEKLETFYEQVLKS